MFLAFLVAIAACHVRSESQGPRIYNGIPAAKRQFPYQVGMTIFRKNFEHINFFCGGAIISREWIVTAAHCLYGDILAVKVFMGSTTNQDDHDRKRVQVMGKEYLMHHKYKYGTDPRIIPFDIAVLKLRRPLRFNRYIKPIALASDEVPLGVNVVVSGFGRVVPHGNPIADLKYSNQHTIRCVPPYQGRVCAQADLRDRAQNACMGDSGGPLVANGTSGPVLVGVVSVGTDCVRSGYTSYASIAFNRRWIKQQTGV